MLDLHFFFLCRYIEPLNKECQKNKLNIRLIQRNYEAGDAMAAEMSLDSNTSTEQNISHMTEELGPNAELYWQR